MVHPARLELTTFYSGAGETPLKNSILSVTENQKTAKNKELWLHFGYMKPTFN